MSVIYPISQYSTFVIRNGKDPFNAPVQKQKQPSCGFKDYLVGTGVGLVLGSAREIALKAAPKQWGSAIPILVAAPTCIVTLGAIASAHIIGHLYWERLRHQNQDHPFLDSPFAEYLSKFIRTQTAAMMTIGLVALSISLHTQPICLAAFLVGKIASFVFLHTLLQQSKRSEMSSVPFCLGALGIAAYDEIINAVGLSLATGCLLPNVLNDVVLSICLRGVVVGTAAIFSWMAFRNVATDYLQSFRVPDSEVAEYRFDDTISCLPPTVFEVPKAVCDFVKTIKTESDLTSSGQRSWSGLPIVTLQAPTGHGKYAVAAGLAQALDGAFFYATTERMREPTLEKMISPFYAMNAVTLVRQAEFWARQNGRTAVIALSDIEHLLTPTLENQSSEIAARQFANAVFFEEGLFGFSGCRSHVVLVAMTEAKSAPFEDMLAAFTTRQPICFNGSFSQTGMFDFIQSRWQKASLTYRPLNIHFPTADGAQREIGEIADLAHAKHLNPGQVSAALHLGNDAVYAQIWRQENQSNYPRLFTEAVIDGLKDQHALSQPEPMQRPATRTVILEHCGIDGRGLWAFKKYIGLENYMRSGVQAEQRASVDPVMQTKSKLLESRFFQSFQFALFGQGITSDARLVFDDLQIQLPAECILQGDANLPHPDRKLFLNMAQKTWSKRWKLAALRWIHQHKALEHQAKTPIQSVPARI